MITSGALGKRDTVKKNFRPHNPDWVQFDVLSDYLGVSKTGLFTLLLVLDIAGWSELLAEKFYNRGAPPTISEFSSRNLVRLRIPVQVPRKIYYRIRQ